MATRSKHVLLFLLAAVLLVGLVAPTRAQRLFPGEIEIRQALERLNTLGSVMMIGAHPDDDREVVLAYLSRGRHVRAAYLSLTRGEGGQNLIGPEQGDELGIIRTQELLSSRRIEGTEQYFTRAIDFGFSKTADESIQKWQRDKVLADVVWNIRRFRPDVVIDVFTGTPRDGHGHHQVSAILGQEAFTAAADPTKFPEQLAYVQTWQPKRLMQNPIAIQQNDQKGKEEPRLEIDVGEFSPELGYSYGEIGAISRSTNRSQGQGTAERKGSQKQALITIAGDKASKDIFDGIDITWTRIPGGGPVGALLQQTLDSFVPAHPEAMLPALAQARGMISGLADSTKDPLVARKLQELDETMALASGLSLEAQAASATVTPGSMLRVNITAIRRSSAPVTLTGVSLSGMDGAPALKLEPIVLSDNQPGNYTLNVRVPDDQPYSQPYWLEQPKDGNLYSVRDPRNIGLPENAPVLEAHFTVKIAGVEMTLTRPVQNRYTDQVYGDLIRPLAVVPPVSIDLSEHSLVFADTQPRKIEVPIRSNAGKPSGEAHLEVPAGWKVEPAAQPFDLGGAGEQTTVVFNLTPPAAAARGTVHAVAMVGGRSVSSSTETIQYPHIPTQTLFPPAEASLVRADIKNLSKNIGYVMGAGDEVPGSLRQIGCDVTLLSAEDLTHGDLSRYDAVVTGVRAWNTRADLRANYQRLFDYASNGGTVVVEYSRPEGGAGGGRGGGNGAAPPAATPPPGTAPAGDTAAPAAAPGGRGGGRGGRGGGRGGGTPGGQAPANGAARGGPPPTPRGPVAAELVEATGLVEHIGPYPIHISNDRVTVEEAPVSFPNPQLALLHAPNEITNADFDGWVQERGLYFADRWDSRYLSVLESHDPGEEPLPGGMLYTKYGKGAYVFSAYDWFRELPAGVPGAYRLFANMLSAGKTQQ
ncbi:MAG TPA: PIG-L family deacetylase [Bryobacteraceae bacterium]|jgi:LmbE family N-acetylglucosaminyl deacetylase